MSLLGRRPRLFGLDIGASAVKLVELKRARQGYALLHAAIEPLPPGVVSEGVVRDTQQAAAAVARLLEGQPPRSQRAALAVAGSSVIVRHLAAPAVEPVELADWVAQTVTQHLPFDPDEVQCSYQVFADGADANGHRAGWPLALVMARKDRIGERCAVLQQAGYRPVVMDVEAFALANCYEANYRPEGDEAVALVNVGASLTNLVVLAGRVPLFTRDLTLGGRQCAEAIGQRLGIPVTEAEQQGWRNATLPEVAAVLEAFFEQLAEELRRSLEFFRSSGGTVERLWLTGGCARLPGLLPRLEQALGLPVEELDALRRIRPASRWLDRAVLTQWAPRLAVAIGLALRSFDSP